MPISLCSQVNDFFRVVIDKLAPTYEDRENFRQSDRLLIFDSKNGNFWNVSFQATGRMPSVREVAVVVKADLHKRNSDEPFDQYEWTFPAEASAEKVAREVGMGIEELEGDGA